MTIPGFFKLHKFERPDRKEIANLIANDFFSYLPCHGLIYFANKW